MSKHYDETFKKMVVKEYMKSTDGVKTIADKHDLPEGTVRGWVRRFSEECQYENKEDVSLIELKEIRELKKEILELKKENLFLKKATAFFAKENVRD